ncbi:MAG TPA: hypothetical protein VM033_05490 [Gemmatimonadaceae bacterium]|nr:hypothetical protein [Gemmatimonadaceae bacterium]
MTRPRTVARSIFATLLLTACGQSPKPDAADPPIDPAIVAEQRRRIAAFDSVVRTVNTDSAYRLWHAMLTSKHPRVEQLAVMCEYERLSYRYGQAAPTAIKLMTDTLFRDSDPSAVARLDAAMVGASPELGSDSCKPLSSQRAPEWLRNWTVYELPKLPPSPDSADTTP